MLVRAHFGGWSASQVRNRLIAKSDGPHDVVNAYRAIVGDEPNVTITGPDQPPENSTETWYAGVSEGMAPFTYAWYRDDGLVSSSSSFTGNTGSTWFELRVDVVDNIGWSDADGVRSRPRTERGEGDRPGCRPHRVKVSLMGAVRGDRLPRRGRRSVQYVAAVGSCIASILVPVPAAGQETGGCAAGIRAGASFSDSKVLFRERLGEELERGMEAKTGLALGTDLRCSVTSRLAAVFALEMERLGELGLVHVLTGLDARPLEAGPSRALGVGPGLRAGWGGGDRLGEHSPIDIHGARLDGGPVLGAEIRVEWFATGRLAFHLTGGWRAS